ncbi:MAG: hypothetical protein MK290_08180, partial [Pedosphaera sp.]|nr:hypothetical protein [Pedosphaera sp.]
PSRGLRQGEVVGLSLNGAALQRIGSSISLPFLRPPVGQEKAFQLQYGFPFFASDAVVFVSSTISF